MSKREKIIVIFMVAIAVIAAAHFLIVYVSTTNGILTQLREADNLDEFVASLSGSILDNRVTKTDIYVMELLQESWQSSAFQSFQEDERKVQTVQEENGDDLDKVARKYVYSGFIKADGRFFGIIDGIEYEVGDEVVGGGGYRVMEINAKQIIVTKENREVPLYLIE